MTLPQFKAIEIHFPFLTSRPKKINVCCLRTLVPVICSSSGRKLSPLVRGRALSQTCGGGQTQPRSCLILAHLLKENSRQEFGKR